MSLFDLPVSVSDLTTLETGLEFFINATEANSEATAINTLGSAETVFTYAARLLQNNFLLPQIAMAVDSLMFSQTDTVAELTKLCTQFLPAQAAVAVANGFNPTVYAAEALGLALAGGNGTSNNFATNFGSLSVTAFAQATANVTGVNVDPIEGFVKNWITFYTANPSATFGLSVTLASYGAAFGDTVGVALLNDTSAKLKTDIDLNSDIVLSGSIANALIDNAEGLYKVGVPLGSLPAHQLLQGESATFNLVGATGTIDMAQLPATIDKLNYQTQAMGDVTIINQNAFLIVDLEDNTTAAQALTVTGAAGLNDKLVISLGNPAQTTGDEIGTIAVTGDELFTVQALGSNGTDIPILDRIGLITLTPTFGGHEQVRLTGGTFLHCGSLADATNDILNINNMVVTINNDQPTELGGSDAAVLDFVTDAGAHGGKFAPSIPYSTNAMTIDASQSNGLVMFRGDANFDSVTSNGDTIIGSLAPSPNKDFAVSIGDMLIGSIGADTLTSNSIVLPDYICTDGGADTITLPANHLGADHVAFYAASDIGFASEGTAFRSVAGAISEVSPGSEFANPGWWGIPAGGSSTKIAFSGGLFDGVATGTGTSADNSSLTGYLPAQDFLDFSGAAWSGGLGLAADKNGTLVNVGGAGLSSDLGKAVSTKPVAPGDSISGTGTVDFIVLSQGTFANAAAVAKALTDGSYTIFHSLLLGGGEADFLMAYQGQDGNAHVADLHLQGHAAGILVGSFGTDHDESVYVSDIVTLVGVSLNNLHPDHIHLVT